MYPLFRDRRHAGQMLAAKLQRYAERSDVIVLALPRGGVPVAYEVALALGAPLDIFLVRKLGMPGHEEFAIGAIASGGIRVLNPQLEGIALSSEMVENVTARERRELERREAAYRRDLPHYDVRGKTAILIDDGLATGSTMQAAVAALRQKGPARIVVAVPVGAPETCAALSHEVDDVICAATPEFFYAVGMWYEHFSQTTDEEVCELLRKAAHAFDPRVHQPKAA